MKYPPTFRCKLLGHQHKTLAKAEACDARSRERAVARIRERLFGRMAPSGRVFKDRGHPKPTRAERSYWARH